MHYFRALLTKFTQRLRRRRLESFHRFSYRVMHQDRILDRS